MCKVKQAVPDGYRRQASEKSVVRRTG